MSRREFATPERPASSETRIPLLVLEDASSPSPLPAGTVQRYETIRVTTASEAMEALFRLRTHPRGRSAVLLADPFFPFLSAVVRRARILLPDALLMASALDLRAMHDVVLPPEGVKRLSAPEVRAELARRAESA